MSKIGIEYQILPPDHLTFVQTSVRLGRSVAGEDLLLAIEQSIQQPLSEDLRNIVRQALIPAAKSRGRPAKFGAALDLAFEKVDQRYPALLRYEQRKKDRLLKSGKAALKGRISVIARLCQAAAAHEGRIWPDDPGSTQEHALAI